MSQVFTYIDTVFLQIVTQYYDQRFALNHIACIIAYICVYSICYCLLEEIGLLICIKGDSKYFGYKVLQVNLSTTEKENLLFLTTTNMISNSS